MQTKTNMFQNTIKQYYRAHGRALPWRKTKDPYRIFVSEIMLQQTQVDRVLVKYPVFIKAFPTFQTLARASLADVLRVWQGMGYNRRAKFIRDAAQIVIQKYKGVLPDDPRVLVALPGVGAYTAGALSVFVYNIPALCIETNIRRVFIHFFFARRHTVSDAEIAKIVERTLDRKNPRIWYWALMDYGTMLGRMSHMQFKNPNRKSAHYARQSAFQGSDRQIRGAIMRLLIEKGLSPGAMICRYTKQPHQKVQTILAALCKEKLIMRRGDRYGV